MPSPNQLSKTETETRKRRKKRNRTGPAASTPPVNLPCSLYSSHALSPPPLTLYYHHHHSLCFSSSSLPPPRQGSSTHLVSSCLFHNLNLLLLSSHIPLTSPSPYSPLPLLSLSLSPFSPSTPTPLDSKLEGTEGLLEKREQDRSRRREQLAPCSLEFEIQKELG